LKRRKRERMNSHQRRLGKRIWTRENIDILPSLIEWINTPDKEIFVMSGYQSEDESGIIIDLRKFIATRNVFGQRFTQKGLKVFLLEKGVGPENFN